MKISIFSPVKAYIYDYTSVEMESLTKQLSYSHTGNQHQYKRLLDNHWFRSKNPIKWEEQLNELKKKLKFTLIYEDGEGKYIRPGSIPYLVGLNLEVKNDIQYPTPKPIKWKEPLPFELYPYQEEGWQKLLKEKYGNVSYCTGSGKSACILKLCQEIGLSAAVVVPSKSIFLEICKLFEHHFGKDKIGYFGNGKKKIGKLFTICIADSLVNIDRDSEEWKFFNDLDVLVSDESHLTGSETLEDMCHGVLSNIPYRFFLSGTQTRGDGTLKLLQSIIGKTVNELTTAEAVEKGFICLHEYNIIETESSNPNLDPRDALESKRIHFLRNRNIAEFIIKFCNTICPATGKQVLILVEELEQIAYLATELRVPFVYAHAESKKAKLESLGLEKVFPDESVEKFNKNEASVLIGTSCVSTGTNIYPVHFCFNWTGGSSEIKTKQGPIGRSIRKLSSSPWADKCVPKDKAVIYDFSVKDVELMKKHLLERISYYKESGTTIKFIKLK